MQNHDRESQRINKYLRLCPPGILSGWVVGDLCFTSNVISRAINKFEQSGQRFILINSIFAHRRTQSRRIIRGHGVRGDLHGIWAAWKCGVDSGAVCLPATGKQTKCLLKQDRLDFILKAQNEAMDYFRFHLICKEVMFLVDRKGRPNKQKLMSCHIFTSVDERNRNFKHWNQFIEFHFVLKWNFVWWRKWQKFKCHFIEGKQNIEINNNNKKNVYIVNWHKGGKNADLFQSNCLLLIGNE